MGRASHSVAFSSPGCLWEGYGEVVRVWRHAGYRFPSLLSILIPSQPPRLDKAGITHVVNCTDNMPQYHEKSSVKPQIKYLRCVLRSHCDLEGSAQGMIHACRFPISFWMRFEKNLPDFLRRAAPYARLSRLVDSHVGPPVSKSSLSLDCVHCSQQ